MISRPRSVVQRFSAWTTSAYCGPEGLLIGCWLSLIATSNQAQSPLVSRDDIIASIDYWEKSCHVVESVKKQGGKSKFQYPTERMSLPGKFKAEIEEYALMLDREQTIDFCRLSEVQNACEDILKTIPPNKRIWAARLFNRLKGAIDGVNSEG